MNQHNNEIKPKLWLIQTTGMVTEISPGELKYKCPDWRMMRECLQQAETGGSRSWKIDIEHVTVWFEGRRCHMFVDEIGLQKGLPPNHKATRVYWNARLADKPATAVYVYNDLQVDPAETLMSRTGSVIVGPVLLWTGEME